MQNNGPMAEEHPISNKECCSSGEEMKLDKETTGEQTTQTEWERVAPLTVGPEPPREDGERTGIHCNWGSNGSMLERTLEKELLTNETWASRN